MTDVQAPPTLIESTGPVAWSTLVALARWGQDLCVTITLPLDADPPIVDRWLQDALAEAAHRVRAREDAPRLERDAVLRLLADAARNGVHPGPGATGLVLVAAPGLWAAIELPVAVERHVHLAEVPYVLPLLPARRSGDRYAALCLSEGSVRYFEGDGSGLASVDVPQLPGDIGGIVWDEALAGPPEAHADRLRRFLRRVDYAVVAHLGTAEPLPLVVVGEPELTARYATASHYPWVVAVADAAAEAWTPTRLHQRTWPEARTHLRAPLQAELSDVRMLAPTGLTVDHPDDIARAARNGEVAALVVAARWCRPGAGTDARGADALATAVVHTWRHRGTVFVADDEQLGPSGVVARLRS